jgi:hypothetical protein
VPDLVGERVPDVGRHAVGRGARWRGRAGGPVVGREDEAGAVESIVAGLAKGEQVFWVKKGEAQAASVPDSKLPPEETISQVRARCVAAGLTLEL